MRSSLEQVPSSPHVSWHLEARTVDSFPFDWHHHPEHELTLILRGGGRRYVGNSVHAYTAGDLVLVGANTPHTWESAGVGGHEAVVLQFRRAVFGTQLFELPEFRAVGAMLSRAALGLWFDGPDATAVSEQIMALPELSPARRTVRLLDVLVELASLPPRPLAGDSLVTELTPAALRRVTRVVSYVHECHSHEVSVREAARLVALTPDAFSRFFRRATGRRFGDYVNEVRLAQSCRRLVEDDAAISRIAAESGYANLSHFNRRFRARTGMSPREYRQQFRGR